MDHLFAFPKSIRLLKSKHFRFVIRNGKCFSGSFLRLHVMPHKRAQPKLGITVPKKFGKAVQRNYFKRVVREIFRLNKLNMISASVIVTPKINKKRVSFQESLADFTELLIKRKPEIKTCCECSSAIEKSDPSSQEEHNQTLAQHA